MSNQEAVDLVFLALCVWREARGETYEAQMAVAGSILNRVKDPGWWGNSVTSVIFKRLQYSSMTDHRDPQLVNWPEPTDKSWLQCLEVAEHILDGTIPDIGGADSYHDVSIQPPAWATQDKLTKAIGRLRFYKVGVRG